MFLGRVKLRAREGKGKASLGSYEEHPMENDGSERAGHYHCASMMWLNE